MSAVWAKMKRDLYPSMQAALERAKLRVRVTYLDNRAPLESQNQAERAYQDAFRGSIDNRPGVTCQRLIGVAANDTEQKKEWIREEKRRADAIDCYEVKFLDLSGSAPIINVSIFDDYAVIIDPCRSRDGSKPRDIHLEDWEVAEVLDRYFDTQWLSAMDTPPERSEPAHQDLRAQGASPLTEKRPPVVLCVACAIAFLLSVALLEVLVYTGQFQWLAQHPNSYGIRAGLYLVLACLGIATVYPPWRTVLLGGLGLGLTVALVSLIGGPRADRAAQQGQDQARDTVSRGSQVASPPRVPPSANP